MSLGDRDLCNPQSVPCESSHAACWTKSSKVSVEHPSKSALQHICFTVGACMTHLCCFPKLLLSSLCLQRHQSGVQCMCCYIQHCWVNLRFTIPNVTSLDLHYTVSEGAEPSSLSGLSEARWEKNMSLESTVEGIIPTQSASYINSPKLLHAMGLPINVRSCSQSLCFVRPHLSLVSAVWHFRLQLLSEELCNSVGQTNLIAV